ncbi:MAG TPA: hypothetical protein VK668_08235 [Mucilaginibacter sp.]|nr:hypothetical protein [Mucilaginibacter sp.]
MTPRSFWIILIRIIGIYIIFQSLYLIVPFVTGVFYIVKSDTESSFMESVLGLIIVAGLYFLVIRYCIFRTESIIDKLQLDKGFTEEKFGIKIHRSTVLKIAIIVIGASMIMDALPMFCKYVYTYFQLNGTNKSFTDYPASGWLVFYFVKLFIGLFMMTSSRLVVNFIELKRKGPLAIDETTE